MPFEIDGLKAGNITYGHRFLAPGPITVRRQDDWMAKLEKAKVIVDPERRREIISTEAKNLAFAQGYELVEDDGLLVETAGLVEWPVVLMGSFDESFLDDPAGGDPHHHPQQPEMLRGDASRERRRWRRASSWSPTWKRRDGGKAIVAGNERVIRARLSDAKFFYETDLKTRLEDRLPKFEQIVFHREARHPGRTHRAHRQDGRPGWRRRSTPMPEKAKRAAMLAKADLLTEVVGEFPELQGLMGKYYALAQGEDDAVAAASEDHYKPLGPNDPRADRSGLDRGRARRQDRHAGRVLGDRREADRLERPLRAAPRRARRHPHHSVEQSAAQSGRDVRRSRPRAISNRARPSCATSSRRPRRARDDLSGLKASFDAMTGSDLRDFFADRLKVQLREQGARHDLADAVLALPGENDLVTIVSASRRSAKFLDTDDGKNLLAGTKRAANILRIEEKKDGTSYTGDPDPSLLKEPEEMALAQAMVSVAPEASAAYRARGLSRARWPRWRSCAPRSMPFSTRSR